MRRSLLTAALACVLVAGVASEAAAAGRGPNCNGARELCQRHLDEVVLPGAHNAMSALDLGWRIPNQTLAIPDQLERGIRALLVDTHYGRLQANGTVRTDDDGQGSVGERGLYLCHVLCEVGASPLVPVLRSIRDFIAANRNTVIVIVNEDHVAPGDFAGAVEESGLGDFVYEDDPGPEWPTLRKMIASREQVVVLAERNAGHRPLVPPRLRRRFAGDAVLVPRPLASHQQGQLAVELPSEPWWDDRVAVPTQPLVAGNAAGCAGPRRLRSGHSSGVRCRNRNPPQVATATGWSPKAAWSKPSISSLQGARSRSPSSR